MIGGGAFNLPQNMARKAGLGAVAIAWIITLIGMFFLANSFRILADKRPDLKAGIYRYAQEGFGPLAGFEMAWGYWLSSALGNVAFAVLVMQMLAAFFPVFGDGKNWPSIIGGSVLIWTMHFIVLSGVKRAASLNVFSSLVNVITIGAALLVMAIFVRKGQLSFDIWGQQQHLGRSFCSGQEHNACHAMGVSWDRGCRGRVRSRKGASARGRRDICRTHGLYDPLFSTIRAALWSHESKGVVRSKNPSTAYVIQALVGDWGAIFVNLAVLFSILFCWLAWTILVAELPYEGAKGGVFPKFLARENNHHAAAPSLWISSLAMQAAMFVVLFAQNAWIWLISITGVISLPPYLASTAFLWMYSREPGFHPSASETRDVAMWTGILGTLFSIWLLYAGELKFLLLIDNYVRDRSTSLLVRQEGARARSASVRRRRVDRGDHPRCRRGCFGVAVRDGIISVT